jgi:hypothetical protein
MSLSDKLSTILVQMLDNSNFRTVDHLVFELKVEWPTLYQQIVVSQTAEFSLSNCGSAMSPVTAVNESLYFLLHSGLVEKIVEQGATLWRLKS